MSYEAIIVDLTGSPTWFSRREPRNWKRLTFSPEFPARCSQLLSKLLSIAPPVSEAHLFARHGSRLIFVLGAFCSTSLPPPLPSPPPTYYATPLWKGSSKVPWYAEPPRAAPKSLFWIFLSNFFSRTRANWSETIWWRPREGNWEMERREKGYKQTFRQYVRGTGAWSIGYWKTKMNTRLGSFRKYNRTCIVYKRIRRRRRRRTRIRRRKRTKKRTKRRRKQEEEKEG